MIGSRRPVSLRNKFELMDRDVIRNIQLMPENNGEPMNQKHLN